jgi:phosphomevalonate kinase
VQEQLSSMVRNGHLPMPEASAPGKLIIVGEYAVIEGAPAIATAVDVRARATVSGSDDRDSILFDALTEQVFHFYLDSVRGLRWRGQSPGARGTILEAVFETFRERLAGEADPQLRFSIDTDSFYAQTPGGLSKLGLGSSAAALVALVGAFMGAVGWTSSDAEMLSTCCTAHRKFQGGRGSGIDVATALTGGVVGIRPGELDAAPTATSLEWLDGLLMLPVWSGSSASTPELLDRFNQYRDRDPDKYRHHIQGLTSLAEDANQAWVDQSLANFLAALEAYDSALQAMDVDGAIGINTATHDVLRGLSSRYGAIYKTSGAGGGDFGIALTDSPDAIKSLKTAFADSGYLVLNNSQNVDGLTVVDRTRSDSNST